MQTIYLVMHYDAHGENGQPLRAFLNREGAEALKGGRELFKEVGDDSYDSIVPISLSAAESIGDVLKELRAG